MRHNSVWGTLIVTLTTVALLPGAGLGAQPASKQRSEGAPPDSAADQRLQKMLRQARVYELTIEGERPRPLGMHDEPLLRFNNLVSGVPDGIIVMWTDGKRPAVLAQVFQTADESWVHEVQSMAPAPLEMRDTDQDRSVWAPREKGLEWTPVDDLTPPTGSPGVRLVQMRRLAESFSATDEFKISASDTTTSRYQLRLLPRPLYRYSDAAEHVIDAAVFGFVHGTDPEIFLVIEALARGDTRSWRYALAPMTCWAVSVEYNGAEVWSLPERLGKSTREGDYHVWLYEGHR